MPNPASTYCGSKTGGTSQILTGPDGGQTGFCAFGGPAAAIEEWTLFRTSASTPAAGVAAPPPQAAVAAFLAAKGALGAILAPGSNVCESAGGVAVTYKCAPPLCLLGTPQLTVCSFPDNSAIAAQALAAGAVGSPLLAAALK